MYAWGGCTFVNIYNKTVMVIKNYDVTVHLHIFWFRMLGSMDGGLGEGLGDGLVGGLGDGPDGGPDVRNR